MTSKVQWKWVVGISEGKVVFLGPYPPDPNTRAEEIAVEKFDPNSYEVVKLPYYGRQNATGALKHVRLENSTLREALERVKHDV